MLDKALPYLQKATRLNPGWSAAFGNLGLVYSRTGQSELAIQAFSRAIELDNVKKANPNLKYYYSRATAYEAAGQLRDAAADYKVSCLLSGKIGCDKISLH